MLDFFRGFAPKRFALGAIESPEDLRRVSAASFQKEEELPDYFEFDLNDPRNQFDKPKCVGSSIRKVAEVYNKLNTGIFTPLSDDDLYDSCKKIDSIPEVAGTYPFIGAKLACEQGIATQEAYESNDFRKVEESRKNNKLKGYAFVGKDYQSVCQAIYKNKVATVSFVIDTNWFIGIIARVVS